MRLLVIALLVALASPAYAEVWAPQTPDILLIIADDMGDKDFNTGKIPTPNINAMAAEGMKFNRWRAATPICATTRWGIETGRYSWRYKEVPRNWTRDPYPLPEGMLTLAKMLNAMEYVTHTYGKWHGTKRGWHSGSGARGIDWSLPLTGGPVEAGYDYSVLVTPAGTPGALVENGYVTEEPTVETTNFVGNTIWTIPGWTPAGAHTALVDKAEEKIAQHTGNSAPLFVHFQPMIPHRPIVPTSEFTFTSQVSRYGDYIAQLDSYVGRLVEAVTEMRGVPPLVIFMSDNGSGAYYKSDKVWRKSGKRIIRTFPPKGSTVTCCNHDPNGILRNWKHSIYEGGLRVPGVVWWPGVVAAGVTADEVLTLDLCRTIARVVGFNLPTDQCVDSFDFWPSAVPGTDRDGPKRTVSIVQNYLGDYGLVNRRWKVLQQAHELYDLDDNESEAAARNLWFSKPRLRNNLLGKLNAAKASSATYPSF